MQGQKQALNTIRDGSRINKLQQMKKRGVTRPGLFWALNRVHYFVLLLSAHRGLHLAPLKGARKDIRSLYVDAEAGN